MQETPVTTTIKSRRGGARANCGRKPIADKKVQIYFFIRQSIIESFGGKDAIKQFMLKSITKT